MRHAKALMMRAKKEAEMHTNDDPDMAIRTAAPSAVSTHG